MRLPVRDRGVMESDSGPADAGDKQPVRDLHISDDAGVNEHDGQRLFLQPVSNGLDETGLSRFGMSARRHLAWRSRRMERAKNRSSG